MPPSKLYHLKLSCTLYTTYSYYMQGYGTDKDFLDFLNRVQKPKTTSMNLGVAWETFVYDLTQGMSALDARKHVLSLPFWEEGRMDDSLFKRRMALCNGEWDIPAKQASQIVAGGLYQQKITRKIKLPELADCTLVGVADFIANKAVYDTKFCGEYDVGHYSKSIQHLVYMYLTGYRKFGYLVFSDGKRRGECCELYHESYQWTKESEVNLISKLSEMVQWIMDSPFKDAFLKNWSLK